MLRLVNFPSLAVLSTRCHLPASRKHLDKRSFLINKTNQSLRVLLGKEQSKGDTEEVFLPGENKHYKRTHG